MTQRNTTTETSDLSVHAGHRQRLRERFLRGGPDDLAAHELLELLLGYAMPRVDVNPLAHRLIERFGSLSGVTEASVEELMSVSGVGEYTACLIRLLPAVVRRCAIDRVESPRVYDTVGKLVEFLRPRFTGLTTERVYLILLDNGMHMIDCRVISEGVPSMVNFRQQFRRHRPPDCRVVPVYARRLRGAGAQSSQGDCGSVECRPGRDAPD